MKTLLLLATLSLVSCKTFSISSPEWGTVERLPDGSLVIIPNPGPIVIPSGK